MYRGSEPWGGIEDDKQSFLLVDCYQVVSTIATAVRPRLFAEQCKSGQRDALGPACPGAFIFCCIQARFRNGPDVIAISFNSIARLSRPHFPPVAVDQPDTICRVFGRLWPLFEPSYSDTASLAVALESGRRSLCSHFLLNSFDACFSNVSARSVATHKRSFVGGSRCICLP